MNVSSLSVAGLPSISPNSPLLPPSSTSGGSGGDQLFSHVLGNVLSQASGQQQVADQAVLDLATGKTDSLHNVVLEVAKADLAFRLMLEIRNRLSDAYQEVMKMQV